MKIPNGRWILCTLGMTWLITSGVHAEEINLANGDRITGQVAGPDEGYYTVTSEILGVIRIPEAEVLTVLPAEMSTSPEMEEGPEADAPDPSPSEPPLDGSMLSDAPAQDSTQAPASAQAEAPAAQTSPPVTEPVTAPAPVEEAPSTLLPAPWEGSAAIGVSARSGNVSSQDWNARIKLKRKTRLDEWTIEGKDFYSEREGNMTVQKYDGSARYAHRLGIYPRLFSFAQGEIEHDRFANIDYRLTPVAGLGYWIIDAEQFRWMTEAGAGFSLTQGRDETDRKSEYILVPRTIIEKDWGKRFRVSEEVTAYPSLTLPGEYRLKFETSGRVLLTAHMAFRLSLLNEYNSDPGPGFKHTDSRLISALEYSF